MVLQSAARFLFCLKYGDNTKKDLRLRAFRFQKNKRLYLYMQKRKSSVHLPYN